MPIGDYTFEQYVDVVETHAWYEQFLLEHNGQDWERKLGFPLRDYILGRNLPVGPNGEATRIFWYRIKLNGVLVGYADAKIHPIFNGRKVISDVWIIPRFRKLGHYHRSFAGLVEHTHAVGVCLMLRKVQRYGHWYESFGFDWSFAYGANPTDDLEDALMFLVTRSAFKDMLRFMITYCGSQISAPTGRGRTVYEEVMKELTS